MWDRKKLPQKVLYVIPSAVASAGQPLIVSWDGGQFLNNAERPAMSTVIIGAGIIGLSTAYYLSESKIEHEIHLVESSPELFASASGFAAGFLAADWYSPSLARLGLLSFRLHKELAEAHNGQERWGYSRSTGTSLAEASVQSNGVSGADWLREGVSRATAAEKTEPSTGNAPSWLKSKGDLDVLSNGDTTAQVLVTRLIFPNEP